MVEKIIREIEHCLIIVLIILSFIGYAVTVAPAEPEEEAICRFPCQFQDPVYKLPAKSVKYEYLKTIKKGG